MTLPGGCRCLYLCKPAIHLHASCISQETSKQIRGWQLAGVRCQREAVSMATFTHTPCVFNHITGMLTQDISSCMRARQAVCIVGAIKSPTMQISQSMKHTVCELIWSRQHEWKCVFSPQQAQQGMHVAEFQQDRSRFEDISCSLKYMVPELMSAFAQSMTCAVNVLQAGQSLHVEGTQGATYL